jgi:phosphomannomutase
MNIDPSIFKAYDIRGTTPEQLNGEIAYQVGAALNTFLKPKTVVVGRDMRTSSDELATGLIRGLNDGGVDVVDIGLCSTDGLYFAVGKYEYDGGIMITASHNPKEYNGFKICRKMAEPLSGQDGLNQLLQSIQDNTYQTTSASKGITVRKEIGDEYTAHCLSFIDVDKVKPYRIVIDAGNGMAGLTLPPVLEKLPVDITRLYFELDGTFPNHPASPIELENLIDLQKKIAETKADFGVAFDGDADRMFLIDKFGNQLGGDMVTALVAKSLLARSPDESVLYNLICSHAVPELIERSGGRAIRTRVGHALIKPLMKKHDAIFGGEHSGHFYFRDFWFADSGLIAFLVCLELISSEDKPLHDMVREINPYFRSGEINSRVDSISDTITRVKEAFAKEEQDEMDGLTVTAGEYWFNLRPSNTEPLLRLNVEANSELLLRTRTEQILKIIRGQ